MPLIIVSIPDVTTSSVTRLTWRRNNYRTTSRRAIPSTHLCEYQAIYVSISPPTQVHTSLCPSMWVSTHLSINLSIQVSSHLCEYHIYMGKYQPIWVGIYSYKYQPIFVSINLPMWVSTRPLLTYLIKCPCYNLDLIPNYIPRWAHAFTITFVVVYSRPPPPPPPTAPPRPQRSLKTTLIKDALSSISVNKNGNGFISVRRSRHNATHVNSVTSSAPASPHSPVGGARISMK